MLNAPKIDPRVARQTELATALRLRLSRLNDFAAFVNPKFQKFRHIEVLAEQLERISRKEIRRLMCFMPPRHGKSELVSRTFPAYHLFHNPNDWVGLASYGAQLATGFSRAARSNYTRAGGVLRSDSSAADLWQTLGRGGMWAAGVGGEITGKGFHVGIVDDPLKNAEEAASATIKSKHKDWWQSTFYTREEPGGAIIIIMTRWDEDDLAGWLLEREEAEKESEGWTIINLPAIKTGAFYSFPTSCTVLDDGRAVDDPLCPERYSAETLDNIKGSIGPFYYEALYQQRPRQEVGKGRVYQPFSLDVHVTDEVSASGLADIYVGMDFNVDPMAAVLGRKVADQLHIFDEVVIPDYANTEMMCAEIARRYPKAKIHIRPDPSGKQRKTNAAVGQTDFSIIRKHGFDLYAPNSAPAVVDRINSVNVLLGDGGAEPRLYIHPRCKGTIRAMDRMTYKPGTKEPDKSKGYDHVTDALGYLVWAEFPVDFKHSMTRFSIRM